MYTKEDILIKFKEVHGDEYDYSNMIYKNRLTKIEIVCKEHGQFTQTPAAHISGQGCPECAKSKRAKGKRISFEEFISRAKKAHGDKFSYDEKSYSGIESPLKIICSSHGEFTQVGKTHLKSHGCPKCGNDSAFKKLSLSKEDFVEKAIEIHGNKFLYDNLDSFTKNGKQASTILTIAKAMQYDSMIVDKEILIIEQMLSLPAKTMENSFKNQTIIFLEMDVHPAVAPKN